MPKFGRSSSEHLSEAHVDLQRLFNEVIKHYDCSVIQGHRDQATQNHYFSTGKSKVQWPDSKHNTKPSLAVDVVPYFGGADWDESQCRAFGAWVCGAAAVMGINIRWGGDWDGDNDVNDQTFNDLVHFELVDY